jgi:penicillin amidase
MFVHTRTIRLANTPRRTVILTRRFLRALLIVIAIIVVAAAGGGTYLFRRAFPVTGGRLTVSGLRSEVEVIRDRWGVPHVFARNTHDLIFAQGYVHAQDRLWQMELNRRAASGRLSEISGRSTLETDRFLRTIGLRRAAEAEVQRLSPDAKAMLERYAAGVNAFLDTPRRRLPIEFTILGFSPEPWTPTDSLAFAKLMGWILSGNWGEEILRAHLLSRFGPEGVQVLLPPYPADAPVIVPAEAEYRSWNPTALLRLLDLAQRPSGLGSNNWVIAGARTATGTPLLANDPHLEAAMPSVWYEMHLSGGGYNAIGSTFPGTAGIVIGHNDTIAWGVTNAGPDVQDLYIERFDPNDPTRYLYKGQWLKAQVIQEKIAIKGAEPVIETVRVTRHGPILNGVVEGLGAFLALRWTALEPGTLVESVWRVGLAKNWDEFRQALALWTVPAQNFVFADRAGNIGYQLPGRIPIRAKGDGLVPVPGWTGEYEWVGEVPFEALPSASNPSRGFIVTANNQIVPDNFPYLISRDWDPGYRAGRITALLSEMPNATIEQIQRVQMDVTSLPGQALVRALQGVRVSEDPAAGALAELRAWNGVLAADSRAAAIYQTFRLSLLPLLFKDVLGPDLFERYLARPDAWQSVITRLLADPQSPWWGPDGRDAVVTRALNDAIDVLTAKLGTDRGRWTWGRLHVMEFVHPIGRISALAWIFNATAPATGGDIFTVNNGGFDRKTYRQTVVASYRQILDPGDWDRSVSIHTTGQSGLPFHRHYRDFVPMWATGQYHPMFFSRERIDAAADGRLVLSPP